MKLPNFPDCIDVHVSETFLPGRSEARASMMLHAIAIGEEGATAEEIMRTAEGAAESLLMGAGLRAAIHVGADIMPFLQLGTQFKRSGGDVGTLTAICNHPNDEHVVITWNGLDDIVDPDVLGDDLRLGALVLA